MTRSTFFGGALALTLFALLGCETGKVDQTDTTTETETQTAPADHATDSTDQPEYGGKQNGTQENGVKDPAVREEPVQEVPEKLNEEGSP